MSHIQTKSACAWALVVALFGLVLLPDAAWTESPRDVVISELAWMGTTVSADAEWIELYNNTSRPISLAGWTLSAADGAPAIALVGILPAGGYFLLERTSDASVPGIAANQIYAGALDNGGENLILRNAASTVIDQVDCSAGWFSGHDKARVAMARVDALVDGSLPGNWTYSLRCSTPTNSSGSHAVCPNASMDTFSSLDYAVYFNERATTATDVTTAHTPMEDALLHLIGSATARIDAAIYGLDRQSIVNALIAAHNRGVTVRVVGDDEAASGAYAGGYQALAQAGIPVVTDATPGKLQHNTFLILDGSVLWTGSAELTDVGLTLDATSSLVITDPLLAGIYTSEFEEMWSGLFHERKGDNTIHALQYSDALVESYFSPTDLAAFEAWDELAGAGQTIHLAMSSWTDKLLARRVIERFQAGVEVYGILDQVGKASVSSQDGVLCAAGVRIGIEDLPGRVHHNFAVVDVEGDDPVVILGSYPWTEAGAYDNDENMLVVHDRELARAYYDEWQRLWSTVRSDRVCGPSHVYMPLVMQSRAWSTPSFGYGIQAHGEHKLPEIVQSVQDLNLGWVKQQVRWSDIEGTQGNYGWAGLDWIADHYNQAGFKVLFSVTAAPGWTRPGKPGNGPPDDYQHFYNFMGKMAAHFRGRVHAYEIWNEPNATVEWNGVQLSAWNYVRLLAGAYRAIKAVDPEAVVVSAAPIPTGINDGVTAIDDRVYLNRIYLAGGKDFFDAVGAHPYGFANPPDVLYAGGDFDPERGWDDHPSFFFRNTMEDYYRIMVTHGDGGKRIWATEFGWPTVDGMGVPVVPGQEYAENINESQQADYTVRAYAWAHDWGHAGIMFLWNLNMWPAVGPYSEMSKYSLVRGDWSPRPVYFAVKYMNKAAPSSVPWMAGFPVQIMLPIVVRPAYQPMPTIDGYR